MDETWVDFEIFKIFYRLTYSVCLISMWCYYSVSSAFQPKVKLMLRHVLRYKNLDVIFCQSLLLSTRILNDIVIATHYILTYVHMSRIATQTAFSLESNIIIAI